MNWIFPFSWKETTDSGNPWSRLLTPKPYNLFALSPPGSILLVGLFLASLVWLFVRAVNDWQQGTPDSIHLFNDCAYVLTVFLAFIAAGLGSRARLQVEHNPLFAESLFTPLQEREYFVAIHRNILFTVFLAVIAPAIFGIMLTSSFYWTSAEVIQKLEQTNRALLPFESLAFRPYSYLIRYRFLLMNGSEGIGVFFGAAALVNVVCWGVGFYLHGLVLAQVSHHKPGARFEGAMMTFSLMFLMMMLYLIRFAIIPALIFPLLGLNPVGKTLLVYYILSESVVIGLRVLAINLIWRRILREGFKYSRIKFFGE